MPDPIQLARAVADALESAGLPYAIGGALALGYWAPPRGTADVDVNIFVGPNAPESVAAAVAALESVGVDLSGVDIDQEVAQGGVVRGWVGRTAVDAFFDSIELHGSAAARARRLPLLGRPAWVLAPEDLIVLKLLFFRGKDLVDVESIVASQADLDRGYVRRWLVECMGEDDARVEEWDRLIAAAR